MPLISAAETVGREVGTCYQVSMFELWDRARAAKCATSDTWVLCMCKSAWAGEAALTADFQLLSLAGKPRVCRRKIQRKSYSLSHAQHQALVHTTAPPCTGQRINGNYVLLDQMLSSYSFMSLLLVTNKREISLYLNMTNSFVLLISSENIVWDCLPFARSYR